MARSSRNSPLVVGGVSVAPGRRQYLEIPVARLATGNEMGLPVCVVHGKQPGPCVWLSAAIHGDEINGVEIIRRVLAELDTKRLRGSVIAVPIVNVFGFISQSRYLPDRRDLNRSFPGSARGSMAGRLAHLFMEEVVLRCSHGIDLHTGSNFRTNLPQVRADLDDPETRRLALAFGAPAMIHSRVRDGSLRGAATKQGIRVLLFEGGEALHFNRQPIAVGTRGVLAVLRELGLIDYEPPPSPECFAARESSWIRAGRGGVLHLDAFLGDRVEASQNVGVVTDAFGRYPGRIRAPRSGMVVGHTTTPLVNKGDAVVHVAFAENGAS